MDTIRKYANVLFQDNTGSYVVGQAPNVLIYVMVVAFIGRMFSAGVVYEFFDLLFFGAAFAWAFLEIRFGDSMFRRIFGSVVMALIFATRLG